MEKKLVNRMLEIIKINEKKKSILDLMKDLELNDQLNTEEYYNYADLYKRICRDYNNILNVTDEDECNEIRNSILILNPILTRQLPFSSIIESDNKKYLTLKRINVDLGAKLIRLYNNQEESALKNAFSMLGIEIDIETENDVDTDLTNECMASDFSNVLYTELVKSIDNTTSKEQKEKLLKMKYNLIYFSPFIERRALLTSFDIPKYPHLVNSEIIYETGLNYDQYNGEFDGIMLNWLEALIKKCIFDHNFNEGTIDLTDLVFLKTFAACLDDSELLDCICVEGNNACSTKCLEAIDIINDTLDQCKLDSMKNKTYRKYNNI